MIVLRIAGMIGVSGRVARAVMTTGDAVSGVMTGRRSGGTSAGTSAGMIGVSGRVARAVMTTGDAVSGVMTGRRSGGTSAGTSAGMI
ncbi:hypothetical protein, partial [Streptomyces sp. CNQ085]|uniref:hypothetical protein n=1 Tax=Streptomyces sp. CNQ085 TaxID=2886944 RepID=UPI0035B3E29B|nr:hypothetical protein [Streptomyces sp. CNQ085]